MAKREDKSSPQKGLHKNIMNDFKTLYFFETRSIIICWAFFMCQTLCQFYHMGALLMSVCSVMSDSVRPTAL